MENNSWPECQNHLYVICMSITLYPIAEEAVWLERKSAVELYLRRQWLSVRQLSGSALPFAYICR